MAKSQDELYIQELKNEIQRLTALLDEAADRGYFVSGGWETKAEKENKRLREDLRQIIFTATKALEG